MILVDVNLLVYAWDRGAALHEAAVQWLDGKLSGSVRVGLPWECLLGFTRVVTNPRIYVIRLGGGAKLIPDAHLAALAIEHGLDLCSTGGDFARFDGLRWVNPLSL
jgi:hypothetical protein